MLSDPEKASKRAATPLHVVSPKLEAMRLREIKQSSFPALNGIQISVSGFAVNDNVMEIIKLCI